MISDLPHTELFAEKHADQWKGCIQCRESHHQTAFCVQCDRCRFCQKQRDGGDWGTIVDCECGLTDLWD